MRWEDHVIYNRTSQTRASAWTLYKDGVRRSFKPGVETQRSCASAGAAAGEDLRRTPRRSPDAAVGRRLPFVAYTFRELASENAVPIERADKTAPSIGGGGTPGGDAGTADPTTIRRQVEEEAPPKREGCVDRRLRHDALLPGRQRDRYLHKEVERDTARICAATCSPCVDLLSCRPTARFGPS